MEKMMMNRAVQLSMTVGLRSITNSWNMFSGAISMLVQARSNILKRIIFSVNQFICPQQLPKVEKPTRALKSNYVSLFDGIWPSG